MHGDALGIDSAVRAGVGDRLGAVAGTINCRRVHLSEVEDTVARAVRLGCGGKAVGADRGHRLVQHGAAGGLARLRGHRAAAAGIDHAVHRHQIDDTVAGPVVGRGGGQAVGAGDGDGLATHGIIGVAVGHRLGTDACAGHNGLIGFRQVERAVPGAVHLGRVCQTVGRHRRDGLVDQAAVARKIGDGIRAAAAADSRNDLLLGGVARAGRVAVDGHHQAVGAGRRRRAVQHHPRPVGVGHRLGGRAAAVVDGVVRLGLVDDAVAVPLIGDGAVQPVGRGRGRDLLGELPIGRVGAVLQHGGAGRVQCHALLHHIIAGCGEADGGGGAGGAVAAREGGLPIDRGPVRQRLLVGIGLQVDGGDPGLRQCLQRGGAVRVGDQDAEAAPTGVRGIQNAVVVGVEHVL